MGTGFVAILKKCSLLKSASLLAQFSPPQRETPFLAEFRKLGTRINTGFVGMNMRENFEYHLEKLYFSIRFPKLTRMNLESGETAKILLQF